MNQIIRILAEAESPGNSVASVARKYGDFSASEAKRLKALLAEKELEIQTLTELIKKLLT
ncbi:MAG TPA: hypothetical protein ENG63_09380 [Candidatus Desulfofervidus auxilii]|uniref:Uncharacterized protein n=1 Tax=Desulfofervidus auxilii TaxID=1621989 RepID=A0A7C0Y8D9_DESA2|nr:hypothetical protein [Candidatus Desulfofervidus auxilii]